LSKAKLALFFLGAFALALAVVVELTSLSALGTFKTNAAIPSNPAPGIGIRALILIDFILAYAILLIAVDMAPGFRTVFGRIQGVLTLVLSILSLIIAIAAIYLAIALVVLMLSLLLSPPFGTIAYFAIWGDFDKSTARLILSTSMFLKMIGVGMIVVSNPSFLKNIGFMLLMVCSLAATFVLGLLHAFPPSFLVSITDGIGAIIAGIIALIWSIVLLIGAVLAIIRAIRSVSPV
jgi:hypothetical protein